MTALQDKLRDALRETADEIPAQPPPLDLSPQPRASRDGRNTRWRAWATPLAAAALVLAAVGASLAVAGNLTHQPVTAGPQAGLNGVPAYYVALITAKPQSDSKRSRLLPRLQRRRAQIHPNRRGPGQDHPTQAVRVVHRGDRRIRRPHVRPVRAGRATLRRAALPRPALLPAAHRPGGPVRRPDDPDRVARRRRPRR